MPKHVDIYYAEVYNMHCNDEKCVRNETNAENMPNRE